MQASSKPRPLNRGILERGSFPCWCLIKKKKLSKRRQRAIYHWWQEVRGRYSIPTGWRCKAAPPVVLSTLNTPRTMVWLLQPAGWARCGLNGSYSPLRARGMDACARHGCTHAPWVEPLTSGSARWKRRLISQPMSRQPQATTHYKRPPHTLTGTHPEPLTLTLTAWVFWQRLASIISQRAGECFYRCWLNEALKTAAGWWATALVCQLAHTLLWLMMKRREMCTRGRCSQRGGQVVSGGDRFQCRGPKSTSQTLHRQYKCFYRGKRPAQ